MKYHVTIQELDDDTHGSSHVEKLTKNGGKDEGWLCPNKETFNYVLNQFVNGREINRSHFSGLRNHRENQEKTKPE